MSKNSNQQRRRDAIKSICAEQWVENQTQLRDTLAYRGHYVSQATLSRDLRDLHAYKESTIEGPYRIFVEGAEVSTLEPDAPQPGDLEKRVERLEAKVVDLAAWIAAHSRE